MRRKSKYVTKKRSTKHEDRDKKSYKTYRKQENGNNKSFTISSYFKTKWIEFPNQKTYVINIGLTEVALASVYPETLAEWPQTQHWHQVWICIYLVNTTHPSLVTP